MIAQTGSPDMKLPPIRPTPWTGREHDMHWRPPDRCGHDVYRPACGASSHNLRRRGARRAFRCSGEVGGAPPGGPAEPGEAAEQPVGEVVQALLRQHLGDLAAV